MSKRLDKEKKRLHIGRIYLLLFVLCGLSVPSCLFAQRDAAHALMFGVGSSNQLDTYLSPMEYKGPQFTFLRETLRMTHWANERLSFQSLTQGAFSLTENPAQNANEYGGHIGYNAGWHYNWMPNRKFRLMMGGMLGADAGFLYNERNGNNPAQARLKADLALSLAGIYKFRMWRQTMAARYQADLPLLGCMFSPQFGQSYWEISQGNRDHNICFTTPGNALSFRQILTFDISLGRRYTLRTGYFSDIRQSHVNGIKVHDISRSFLVGFVRHFSLIQDKERKEELIL